MFVCINVLSTKSVLSVKIKDESIADSKSLFFDAMFWLMESLRKKMRQKNEGKHQ